jgi:hypothetical protein
MAQFSKHYELGGHLAFFFFRKVFLNTDRECEQRSEHL